eukprot:265939-Prymnesium_polylepis.3
MKLEGAKQGAESGCTSAVSDRDLRGRSREILELLRLLLRWKYAELCGTGIVHGWVGVLVVRDMVLYGLSQIDTLKHVAGNCTRTHLD